MALSLIAALAAGYLLGSLPFGWAVARLRGVDIFAVGSRSSGATNVRRSVGAGAGNAVFVLDALKGVAAAGWPLLLPQAPHHAVLSVVSLGAALLGHSFSCFTAFRGGKGVATGAGGFLVLLPLPTLISAAVWIAAFAAWRYVSLASILSAVAMPVAAVALGVGPLLSGVAAAVGAFVIVRHRANISRLLAGTENRGGRRE